MNWYLVARELDELILKNGDLCIFKEEPRVYPIGQPIPLIYKDTKRCVGLVEIKSFKVSKDSTEIIFNMVESFDKFYPIAQHYYDMYKKMQE